LSKATPPSVELDELVCLFYRQNEDLAKFIRRDASECPPAYRELLAHEAHMTVTVERRHGCPVDVEVLESRCSDTQYVRRILLRRTSDRRVVQFGIVRLALSALQPVVREEIMARKSPLGRVLIKHNVLRQVHLDALWEVQCAATLAQLFGVKAGHTTFGRTALIYCDGDPAVELLEILAPEDSF
jgi:chorismate-pyruvate lyase